MSNPFRKFAANAVMKTRNTRTSTHRMVTRNRISGSSGSSSISDLSKSQHEKGTVSEKTNKRTRTKRKKTVVKPESVKIEIKYEEPDLPQSPEEEEPRTKKKKNRVPRTKSERSSGKLKKEKVEASSPAKPRPKNWQDVWAGIEVMRSEQKAAVDTMGCDRLAETDAKPHEFRFQVLLAAVLSSRTTDEVNHAAMGRLKSRNMANVEGLLATEQKVLAEVLKPVGFFNNKSKYIHKICTILKDNAITKQSSSKTSENGDSELVIDIPRTYEELVALPGVGPKMAHLVMTCAWDDTSGICVDIHVHRIANRLGWAKTWNTKGKSQDPEKTREELESWLPRDHWGTINPLLVGFGQTLCKPLKPRCDECKVSNMCPKAFKNWP